jgi:hypothetical protein
MRVKVPLRRSAAVGGGGDGCWRRGAGQWERRKRGRGMNGREERSIGIETRRPEALARVSPTEPLRLEKQAECMPRC